MPIPISETTWECVNCGEEFDDRGEAVEHENECEDE